MKSFVRDLCFVSVLLVAVCVFSVSYASELDPIPGAGWHYPYKDAYAKWTPGNNVIDPRVNEQEIIASYGWGAKNVDEIKDLIPPSLYTIMKNPDVWGAHRINITPLLENKGSLWKKYKKATGKYKGTAYVDEQGWIRNYKAGCPFPEPKNGLEAAWNFRKNFSEDDRIVPVVLIITSRSGNVRYQAFNGDLMYFDGRLEIPPKPIYTPNPDKLMRVDVAATIHPYEMQGTLSVIKTYDDPSKLDDLWVYLPAMRRIRRLSTSQRTDKLPGGLDIMWDSFDTFGGKVNLYTHKLVGRKEILVGRNGKAKPEWVEGGHVAGVDNYYQKVNVYVVETRAKDEGYPFSKIIRYLDPEAFFGYYSEFYDTKGQPAFFVTYARTLTKSGLFLQTALNHINMQGERDTSSVTTGVKYNIGLKPSYFMIDNLKRVYTVR